MGRSKKYYQQIGLLSLLGASFIWGVAYIPTRHLGQNNVSVFFEILVRYTIPSIVILLLFFKDIISSSPQLIWKSILLGIVLFISLSLSIFGIQQMSYGSLGLILISLHIILVPIASFLFFRRKISFILAISIAISIIGTVILYSEGLIFSINKASLLCILASIGYTIYILLASKILNSSHSFSVIQFYQSITIIIFCIPFLFFHDPQILKKIPLFFTDKTILISLGFIGIFAGTIGYWLYFFGQKHIDPVFVPIVLSLQSIFAAILDLILFKIHLSTLQLVSYFLLLISFIIGSCNEYFMKKFQDNK